MRTLKRLVLIVAVSVAPIAAQDQQSPAALDQVVSKIIARESQEMKIIRGYSPLVETYIQRVSNRKGKEEGWEPAGDHYFIGRADFSQGLNLEPIVARNDNGLRHVFSNLNHFFDLGAEYLPRGFLQMVYPDTNGLDTQNYNFNYVRREFLGEVRTLVFDVTPKKNGSKGLFEGRMWVEDEAFTIVRFNGSYSGGKKSDLNFHFDSWRVNAGPNLWLPAFIYSEEHTPKYLLIGAVNSKAQTRLWGFNIGRAGEEQELGRVLIESANPVIDNSQQTTDLSPVEEKRAWDRQAENNVMDHLQRQGLIAPKGGVDKILDTVVNNLEATNHLNFDPEIRCRVLMTSTIESFAVGRTIVLSRGLIDVLPDEASLAAMIAKELGHVMVDRRQDQDTTFGFYDRIILFDEKRTFQHFDFVRTKEEDAAASAKATELLKNSPYKDQLQTAEMFVAELQTRSKEIPNLISPRLGDSVLIKPPVASDIEDKQEAGQNVALPLGGRVKLDPWDDTLDLLKTKPVGTLTEREKMPFEITPFILYLTRVGGDLPKSSQNGKSPLPQSGVQGSSAE
jgi:hypothetical protein